LSHSAVARRIGDVNNEEIVDDSLEKIIRETHPHLWRELAMLTQRGVPERSIRRLDGHSDRCLSRASSSDRFSSYWIVA
jgi:hypothetical protein